MLETFDVGADPGETTIVAPATPANRSVVTVPGGSVVAPDESVFVGGANVSAISGVEPLNATGTGPSPNATVLNGSGNSTNGNSTNGNSTNDNGTYTELRSDDNGQIGEQGNIVLRAYRRDGTLGRPTEFNTPRIFRIENYVEPPHKAPADATPFQKQLVALKNNIAEIYLNHNNFREELANGEVRALILVKDENGRVTAFKNNIVLQRRN
ncbi:Oidioi.mRNA.OKI2018_I69.YSR.g17145.t1.cds [Oikopleura dioica]|uniref:Oidioi.mRNA.OKI2018_I69.YSR.g17145.t1.cds n=1 Tax=Oikopleura dioica TaxID=34765 RepID=A0ABN7SMI6_OIKDI|nr:Oidioi.mRNA.OKI2018_I69.YSR.g17145.t1.cds [Oikopleura dioica]